jgi:FkbM family methyltransferase
MTVLSLAKRAVATVSPALAAKISIWNRSRSAISSGESELKLVPALCRKDGLMLDVGANVGLYSYASLPHAKGVVAFEPHPDMARMLRQWGEGKLTVMEIAASNAAGETVLRIPVTHGHEQTALSSIEATPLVKQMSSAGSIRQVPIKMARIDDLNFPSVGFMKIDVEGHEVEVIQGARETIARCRPRLLVETEERHRPGAPAQVQAMLEELGYTGYFLSGNAFHPMREFSKDLHQALDLGLKRKQVDDVYINNFLFLPDESSLDGLRALLARA